MQEQKWKKQYVMFELNKLSSDIWYWENTISYPEELMDLINNLDFNPDSYVKIPQWKPWAASNDANTLYGAIKMIRSDSVNINLSDERINQNALYIINSLKMAAEMCYNSYMDAHSFDKNKYILDLDHVPVRRWDMGSSMGPHSDSSYAFSNLAFTTVTYLNDNYKGGEIEFSDLNITLKPKAGSTIMFPASVIHQVKEVLSGKRYMSTNSVNMI